MDSKFKANILVGRFGSTIGLRGDIRLNSYCSPDSSIFSFKNLFSINGDLLLIDHHTRLSNSLFSVKIKGICSKEQATILTNVDLYTTRDEFPNIESNSEFYYVDLIGLNVFNEEGLSYGIVQNVVNFGASDILELKNLMIPFTKDFIKDVNFDKQLIIVQNL